MNSMNKMFLGQPPTSTKDWLERRYSYVQDGLMLHWDGIWNAGYKLHDSSTRSLVDLSPYRRDVSLADNIIVEDNCIYIPNETNVLVRRNAGDLDLLKNGWTVECVFKVNDKTKFTTTYGAICGLGQDCGISAYKYGTAYRLFLRVSNAYHGYGTIENPEYAYGSYNYANGFDNITAVSLVSNIQIAKSALHVNGIRRTTLNAAAIVGEYLPSDTRNGFGINTICGYKNWNKATTGGVLGGARYYSFRVYNRALSTEELAHNHWLDKLRFGIA